MSYSEEELEKQKSEIKRNLSMVFIPILIFLLVYTFYLNNSLDYQKKSYEDCRNIAFSGKIIKKRQDGDYPRADRYVILDDYHVQRVDQPTYQKVKIGDLVSKKRGHNSIFFYLKNGETVIIDNCEYYREKYLKLLNKK